MNTTEEPTILKAVFKIPKKHIKNANLGVNHIVGAQKSAWIREYAEKVWLEAVEEQYPKLNILEPRIEDIPRQTPPEEIQKAEKELSHLHKEIKELEEETKQLTTLKQYYIEDKTLLKKLKKNDAPFTETLTVEQRINDYEQRRDANTVSKRRAKAAFAAQKKTYGREINRELGRIERAHRKAYIAKKIELNKKQLLFQTCAVIVRVHNISDHDFDAPNFYPTVKPILDAATDTGVIWPDDNNNIIAGGTLFLYGEKQSREEYVFEIEISSEWIWSN